MENITISFMGPAEGILLGIRCVARLYVLFSNQLFLTTELHGVFTQSTTETRNPTLRNSVFTSVHSVV